ncbi:fatty acid desaturase [Paracrocinitomix mangrovi]|uniref:fatty acid desaturase family protein n=1 Tax=Paracrocinitomix mangrovi TaxID=2862509 RepID=UPI001EDAF258|nr:acyl-CoA desaturase [Paracrocinitomix mangrovi]UKN01655.1 fatty acid desaturase [Paracrocinitomix mangrovi]
MQAIKPITYNPKIGKEFSTTLNKRVRAYFKENNISRYANANMKIKTIFMISLFFIPLGFLLSTLVQSIWLTGLLYFIMGLGTAGIGLSIMHDANHGSYSKNDKVNKALGGLLNLVGGFAPTWRMQHNVLHHTYTNVHGYDEDIQPPGVLRFSPNEERKKIHKFQHLYAWFFYGLMTFSWITAKDFKQLNRYKKMGILDTEKDSYGWLLTKLIFFKVVYYTIALVLPMLIIDIAWYWFVIFVFMYHFVAGLILALVFQPAHVIPETEFVDTKGETSIDNNFMIHQMQTTANFAPESRILYWLIGGLNYQVEHHLFPNICHVHYKKISKIVRETAKEYNVPYNSHTTFFKAIAYHTKLLKSLGRA